MMTLALPKGLGWRLGHERNGCFSVRNEISVSNFIGEGATTITNSRQTYYMRLLGTYSRVMVSQRQTGNLLMDAHGMNQSQAFRSIGRTDGAPRWLHWMVTGLKHSKNELFNRRTTTFCFRKPLNVFGIHNSQQFSKDSSGLWNKKSLRCASEGAMKSNVLHEEGRLTRDRSPTSFPIIQNEGGGLEVFIGPMFAGKTSALLQRVEAYEMAGMHVAVIKSDKDNRYSEREIATHDGVKRSCFTACSLNDFRNGIEDTAYEDIDVLAIDEAQFFSDLAQFCTYAVDLDGKIVIVAGLDGDYRRKRFGQILDLIPLADTVVKLTAVCRFCEEERLAVRGGFDNSVGTMSNRMSTLSGPITPALFSLRMTQEAGQELIGGPERYAPVCRRHYIQMSQDK